MSEGTGLCCCNCNETHWLIDGAREPLNKYRAPPTSGVYTSCVKTGLFGFTHTCLGEQLLLCHSRIIMGEAHIPSFPEALSGILNSMLCKKYPRSSDLHIPCRASPISSGQYKVQIHNLVILTSLTLCLISEPPRSFPHPQFHANICPSVPSLPEQGPSELEGGCF